MYVLPKSPFSSIKKFIKSLVVNVGVNDKEFGSCITEYTPLVSILPYIMLPFCIVSMNLSEIYSVGFDKGLIFWTIADATL